MKKDFEEFFSSINQDKITEQWEEAKIEKRKRNKIALIVIIILDCVIIYFAINMMMGFSYIEFIFPIMMCLVLDIIVYAFTSIGLSKKSREYNSTFKQEIIDNLLKNFFEDTDYIPKKTLPEPIYEEATDEDYDRYFSDDYMEANIDDKYPIIMAEVHTEREEETTDSEGNTTTYYVTVFNGLFAKIDIGKSINNELKIGLNHSVYKKERLEMDSQEFEKYFDVGSSNKIIGMQLLTHDVMELLVDFRMKNKEPFEILIRNNIMYIRFHVGSIFESRINKKTVIDKAIVERYFNIVNFIYSLSKQMIKVVEETEI